MCFIIPSKPSGVWGRNEIKYNKVRMKGQSRRRTSRKYLYSNVFRVVVEGNEFKTESELAAVVDK